MFLFFALLPLQPYSEVLSALEDLFHSLVDEFLLLDQLFRLRVFTELDGLDEAVFERLGQTVGSLHLNVGVTDADEVGD